MPTQDYVVLRIAADLGQLPPTRRGGAAAAENLSVDDVLVARPSGVPVERYVSLETASLSERQALEAKRDPKNLLAPNMPVSLIKPLADADEAVALTIDAIGEARATNASWGIAEVLGEVPAEVDGASVKVAVLDTGIDPQHEAFAGVNLIQRNFTRDGENDLNGHGSHCAGTIFGRDIDGVRVGVARGVTDALIGKVLDDDGRGGTGQILEALKWAHSERADIVSMSLGFDFPRMQAILEDDGHPRELATSKALKAYRETLDLFQALSALLLAETEDRPGMVLVAASGNESRRNLDPDFVIDVSVPAAISREIVSVGASAKNGEARDIAPFSNVNPKVSAPGVGIVSAAVGGGLASMNGTSMACPHVAGVAALWWQWMREDAGDVRAGMVRSQVISSARRDKFVPSVEFIDRGMGSVTAPQG